MWISDVLDNKQEQKVAIIYDNKEYTYSYLRNMSMSVGEKIRGTIEDKNVLLLANNSVDFVISYFSILFSANSLILATPRLTKFEIVNLVEYCDVNCIVVDKVSYKTLAGIEKFNSGNIEIINIEEVIQNINIKEFPTCYKKNDCKIILGSSGTSQGSKRIVLSQSAIVENIKLHIDSLNLNFEDTLLIYLPMCFGYCHTSQFLTSLYLGATMIIAEKNFLAKDFWDNCERYKVTSFTAVPTHILLLNKYRSEVDLSKIHLKHICFGGAKLGLENLKKFKRSYPSIPLLETYGMTELGPRVTTMDLKNFDNKIGSVGKPLKQVEIRITDSEGKPTPTNTVGRVYVKTPCRMLGYYKNKDATLAAFNGDWFFTGDLGFIDSDGYLFITGREKNIIISGGINIYPEEYEQVINSYSHVLESKVYGIQNELLGEALVTDVVVEDHFNLKDFRHFCDNRFGKNKLHAVKVVDSISKTYTGKIKRWEYGNKSEE